MITTVAVAGYRSLRDVVVPLGGLTVVTGANGSGKSNLYRALRLLASAASGSLVAAVAGEGGLRSLLWAGPEAPTGQSAVQGTVRKRPHALLLGFAGDELGYVVDLGIPQTVGPSLFDRDPEVKREQVFAGPVAKPSSLLIDRHGAAARVRDRNWRPLAQPLMPYETILTDLADGDTAPELLSLRRTLGGWRFYDHFRTDTAAPVRSPQVGTRTAVLGHDGTDVAAVWATIRDAGHSDELDREVERAFPGTRVDVIGTDGRLRLVMHQPGLLRPLETDELSDGTLRYLLLCAALLPAAPGPLIVLNEPESSLHPDLLGPLAQLIAAASRRTQVLVVTHAGALGSALEDAGAVTHRLEATPSGTRITGQGVLDRPPWHWGAR
ncbi:MULTISPECIES: AAA family ATPase [unclassified Microbacterium]|uniref:AAA family ATPase n=1 Tax=unclassified Microbacterium TaxID=2609290 RepID=UPI00214BC666|nr:MULTISPECIES: AAA family ATPase [unclassified Microbacterium]MCR2809984.1 AAA family ATPase [Microbacterium sp. zg.B185]WIM20173.1 AAA family ATPase [Microbacterium sp. zg-B185]